MKKTKLFFVLVLIISIFTSSAFATTDNIKVLIDGQSVQFDVPPISINDRTMVPLRAIFEALGATVNWDDTTQTVMSSKGNTTISLTINKNIIYINGVAKTLDVSPTLVKNRTLVPARAISEAFGCPVGWDENYSVVSIINDASNYTMLYASNNRSYAVANSDINTYIENGWHLKQDLSDTYSSTEDKILFLKYLKSGIGFQENMAKCITNYIKTFNDEYQTIFFKALNSSVECYTNCYEMCLKYSDMQPLANDISTVLNIYDNISNGQYSPLTMNEAFSKLSICNNNIIKFCDDWVE